ncbi:uncharacterized protein LOC109599423 [Aethina tumida]|uniref:uncharacterized protein LOC109599423 n=1 Tax=Aethina tumida TaxID=116153 RepID=UPI00096B07E2|nr:uncharacterized protein LOC109599423 [Aethina tumida]
MNPKREKMFTSEFNTKFINLIQSSPAIWNHFDDGFGDREVKRDNWYKIGAQLFENWDEFEEHEKIDLVFKMEARYMEMRYMYIQVYKGVMEPQYEYTQQLSFLDEVFEKILFDEVLKHVEGIRRDDWVPFLKHVLNFFKVTDS